MLLARKSKPGVIIRRHPPPNNKSHRLRASTSTWTRDTDGDDGPTESQMLVAGTSSSSLPSQTGSGDIRDEVALIRELLRPPPIPAVADWGIPPPSTKPVDPAIEVRRRP